MGEKVDRPTGVRLPPHLAKITWPFCPNCGKRLDRPSRSGILQGCALKEDGGCSAAFKIVPVEVSDEEEAEAAALPPPDDG